MFSARLLAATAVSLLSSMASAADLSVYEGEVTPSYPAAAPWAGVYGGVHGGYGWAGDVSGVVVGAPGTPDRFFESDVSGPLFGGQAGANWQSDALVVGGEVDASFAGISVDDEDDDIVGDDDDVVDFLASARLRAGVGLDKLLIHGTGGLGVAGIGDPTSTDDDVRFGWTGGAGAEYLVTDSISVGAQYLHYGFGDEDDDRPDGRDSFDGSVETVTGRVNVKLGIFGP